MHNHNIQQLQPTGFVFAEMDWAGLLDGLFHNETSGVDIVVTAFHKSTDNENNGREVEQESFTYTIIQGQVVPVGPGDWHDVFFEKTNRTIDLLPDAFVAAQSVQYTLTFYANDDFDERFHERTPYLAAWGAAAIVFMTSLLFVAYDVAVRREFHARAELLHAKRQFVRFISHEVRTPLHSCHMGLQLLREEMTKVLGFPASDGNGTTAIADVSSTFGDGASSMRTPPNGHSSSQPGGSSSYANNNHNVQNSISGRACDQNDHERTAESAALTEESLVTQQQVTNWHHVTQEVHANAQSSIDVLNDLLNYDKVETGTLSLELTRLEIWELIESTAAEFKLSAAQKHIQVQVESNNPAMAATGSASALSDQNRRSNKHIIVVGDTVRLTQVMRNLVSNAIKFTPEGGSLCIRATSTTFSDNRRLRRNPKTFVLKNSDVIHPMRWGTLQLEVQDSGAGMTASQVSRLFKQGVQFNVNDLQAGQGSGLGLYIAKGILEQHGGTLTASSEGLGKGTTFCVTLPLYTMQPINQNVSMTPSSAEPSVKSEEFCLLTGKHRTLNILLVDDSTSNRRLLSRLLTNRGHTCDGAEDGAVALDKIRQAIREDKPYDLILLDYEMPVLNGPLTAKTLRQEDGNDVFIVGITGNMLAEDVNYFRSCGANGVLPKPFKIDSLEELCRENGIGYR